jgi:hypothetical protein
MRRHYCAADTRGGVQLMRQHSQAACRQGYSWGTNRSGVWVDHGCRADFSVGGSGGSGYGNGGYRNRHRDYSSGGPGPYNNGPYNNGPGPYSNGPYNNGPYNNGGYGPYSRNSGYGSGPVITCSSDDMHRHYCSANTTSGVRMVQQRSQAACSQGYSWGTNRQGIWVDHGCRADFQLGR